MALPNNDNNLVGSHVLPITDMGLSTTLSANASDTGTAFSTAVPATIVVVSKLSAGDGTLKVDVAATAADIDFSSPTATLSLTGTSRQVVSVDTTTSALFANIQQIAGSGGVTFEELAVLVLYELTTGEEWENIRSGHNSVANNTIGDGSGVFSLDIS